MAMSTKWRYLAGEIAIGLRRNILMTVATVVTVTVSLVLLGAGLLLQHQVNVARDSFYSQVELSIYLTDAIAQSDQEALAEQLRADDRVEAVDFVSKDEALENFEQLYGQEETVRQGITSQDLPASFVVSLTDPRVYEEVAQTYRSEPGVEDITDQREVVDRILSIMGALRNVALVVAGLQLVAAAALIANTIRLAAFARRAQTSIMQLVGATRWYIRLPFMMEGLTAGVVGALAASGLLWVSLVTLLRSIDTQIPFFPFIGAGAMVGLVPVLVLIGGGMAAVASLLSLRRFLRSGSGRL